MFSHNYKPEAIKVGDKKDIEDTRQFFKDLRAEIFAEMAKGTDPEAVPATLKLSKYKDWVHYDDWLAMNLDTLETFVEQQHVFVSFGHFGHFGHVGHFGHFGHFEHFGNHC